MEISQSLCATCSTAYFEEFPSNIPFLFPLQQLVTIVPSTVYPKKPKSASRFCLQSSFCMVTDCSQIPPYLHCFCKMSNPSVLSPSYFSSPAPCQLCDSPTDSLQFAILSRGWMQYYKTGFPDAEQRGQQPPQLWWAVLLQPCMSFHLSILPLGKWQPSWSAN